LFALGKVTSGQAAEIAELPRRRFLLELADHGIPAVSWDAEELETENAAIARLT
jgi:predicted HTH domain antitoxin